MSGPDMYSLCNRPDKMYGQPLPDRVDGCPQCGDPYGIRYPSGEAFMCRNGHFYLRSEAVSCVRAKCGCGKSHGWKREQLRGAEGDTSKNHSPNHSPTPENQ